MIDFRIVDDAYRDQITPTGRGRYSPLIAALDGGATVVVPVQPTDAEGRAIRNRLGNAASLRGLRFRYGESSDPSAPGMVVWFEKR